MKHLTLPQNWRRVRLDEIASRGSGHTPNKKISNYWNGGIRWVSLADSKFLDKVYIEKTDKEISQDGLKNSSAVLHPAGTVVVSRDAGVGKSAILKTPMAVSQHFITWTCNKNETDNHFLYYWLQNLKPELERVAVGSTIKTIGMGYFQKLEINLPPYDEQKKIAKILSCWDVTIDQLSSIIAKKREFKFQLINTLFNLKNGWKEVPLIEVADKNEKYSFTGGPFGSNLKASDYTENGVRIIQLQNIGDGDFLNNYKIFTSEKKADELSSCNIFPGDIILSKMGDPVARSTIIPPHHKRYLMASDGIRLKVDERKFNVHFILEAINSNFFRKKAVTASTGSTRQRIGLSDLKKITLLVPSLEKQSQLAGLFVELNKELGQLEKLLKLNILQKTELMKQLLGGKLKVKV